MVADNLMVGWKGGCFQAQFWNTAGARIVNTDRRSPAGGAAAHLGAGSALHVP